MIARDQIPTVELPTEVVNVEALGGEVLVRGFDLPQFMTYVAAMRRLAKPLEGETQQQADERAGIAVIPLALSMGVLAGDDLPVYTETQWRAFGARHSGQTLGLHEVVMRLSGQDHEAVEKN